MPKQLDESCFLCKAPIICWGWSSQEPEPTREELDSDDYKCSGVQCDSNRDCCVNHFCKGCFEKHRCRGYDGK